MLPCWAGEIAKVAMKRGLITCQGKTPEATMASALYTDVKRKESTSIFIRPHEGLFGLREWAQQGIAFEVAPPLLAATLSAASAQGSPAASGMLAPAVVCVCLLVTALVALCAAGHDGGRQADAGRGGSRRAAWAWPQRFWQRALAV